MKMPACAAFSPYSPLDSKKSFDYFQRKKVGSIRDNPKLLKIRQQFENACRDAPTAEGFRKNSKFLSDSAPSSLRLSLSKTTGDVLDEFVSINSRFAEKTDTFLKSQISSSQSRRHSEGEIESKRTLSALSHKSELKSLTDSPNRTTSSGTSISSIASSRTDVSYKSSSDGENLCNDRKEQNSKEVSSERNACKPANHSHSPKKGTKNKVCSTICSSTETLKSTPLDQSYLILKSFDHAPRSSGESDTLNVKSEISVCDNFTLSNALQNIHSSNLSSSECGPHTKASTYKDDIFISRKCLKSNPLKELSSELGSNDGSAPPIPKRGLSAAVQKNCVHSRIAPTKKVHSLSKELTPSSIVIKSNTVQKAIQMYEGMSSSDVKKNKSFKSINPYQKLLLRNDSYSKRSGIYRRSSRRNSLRKPRCPSDNKENSMKSTSSVSQLENDTHSSNKEDSGVGMSDPEDKSQGVYQTLSSKINIVKETKQTQDTYDRLSRFHDMVNLIHKGLPSACAACKAIPASALELRAKAESSMHQVKCNESEPHHHPPCICFACQHSIFSCSIDAEGSTCDQIDDSLYYNVCCLNPPNREGWRQSRRRPVCEQNGRLCIVNCDMEQRENSFQMSNDFYEKLCEWHSTPGNTVQRRHRAKQRSGDSCDSDESWIDVTDSEDERNMCVSNRCHNFSKNFKNTLSRRADGSLSAQNSAYDIDKMISKCLDLDLSRTSSTEHLYESIADIESQNVITDTSLLSNGSSTLSLKSEQNPENDVDSGEWSTESASPTFDESTNKNDHEQLKTQTLSNQHRFAVRLDSQETAKKTFMKSVLGKKAATQKNRRMSKFFVPWLVTNQDFSPSTSRSQKSTLKKQSGHCQSSSKTISCKNKRSQSIPSGSPKLSMSCTRALFCSAEILDKGRNKDSESENNDNNCFDSNIFLSPPDPTISSSSKGSSSSSTYLRPDQLQTSTVPKTKINVLSDASVDVNVERICRRPSSGDSEHSYILFQPVKEEEVPLYQFYERNIKERISFCRSPNCISPVMWSTHAESNCNHDIAMKPLKPQLSVVEQLSPDAKDMKMLWCELPEVKESGILERISAQELKLQEAAFEFIQSQASYIRSLKVLYENFIKAPEFSDIESSTCVLSKHEHDVLFSDIIRVKEVSERLMFELTTRWSDGILIPDICDIIHRHAAKPSFSVYVRYCSNRVYQERTLKELKETRLCFLEVLRKLESNPACQGLSLESFLFLPMQHIARLPLLLDNIFRWLVPESPSYGISKTALEAIHKIFMECNEGARKMERLEEMFVLNKQLEFKECKVIPLISASRWLLKKGELLKLEFDKKTFGRSSRCVRVPVYIFLFNDLLVVTKRKSDDSYTVVDYCPREKVQAMAVNAKDLQQPVVVPNTCRYLIYLTLFNNHQGSAVDMILNCALLSERTRWIEAIHTLPQNKPCEVWEYDCPQVQCVRTYIAQQPDELSLQESDVVTIHRKMNDGWYEGRRLRDGLQGWFPASYTMDIPCSRARASNLRQCYRLLMLSQSE